MDKKVFRDISYGMYFVGSVIDNKKSGCIINTLCQITASNPIISISLNKDNYTSEAIKVSKKFSVSIISNDTSKEVIGKFGYYTSREVDKFENTNYEIIDDIPVIMEDVCSYIICDVLNVIDCGTHDIIVGQVINTKKISDNVPMTYKYYHENLKGVSPKNAPTYSGDEISSNSEYCKYRCKLCGYVYDEEVEKVRFEELPDDWKCPLCGAPKNMFEKC